MVSALGLGHTTTDEQTKSAWYPVAVRDLLGDPDGAFDGIPAGNHDFELPSDEIGAGGYRFARFRARFVLDAGHAPEHPLPFVDAAAMWFQFRPAAD